ncbi:PE family protein [Mycobacterium intermedium]|uniref:PE family protein n=1 Tax=Mycobacterium intermedium TaxID=28445 RepID=UPI00084924AC|nr:PE family protein [Mycobacterium intermedium]MCV6965054.1 PE family protein [Mycobacterium intermedium]ODQ98008.1 hypothetical protein BHQ20_24175 [Mycobacterium intermedium]
MAPDSLLAAAGDLNNIANSLDEAHRLAAPATLAVSPAAADEVSTGIAQLFSQHAQAYQAVARDAAAFQEQFVQRLTASASSYDSAEEVLAWLLQAASNAVGPYYTTAANTFAASLVIYLAFSALVLLAFLIVQVFAFARFSLLFSEVVAGAPITFPIAF